MAKQRKKHFPSDKLDLNFTDYAPDPTFENEYFGEFRPTRDEFSDRERKDGRFCSDGEFSRSGRGPKGWPSENPRPPHFLIQAIRAAKRDEIGRPTPDPARERAEELERLADRPLDPDDVPFTPSSILHSERRHFYVLHTERRVQALYLRRYRPSKQAELKRFPALKRVKSNGRLTKDYLHRGLRSAKDAARAECENLVAQFISAGGVVQACPPEKLAAQIKPVPKRGRPPINGRAMTGAERLRRHRAKLRSPAPHGRDETGVVQPMPLRLAAPVARLPDEQMIRRNRR